MKCELLGEERAHHGTAKKDYENLRHKFSRVHIRSFIGWSGIAIAAAVSVFAFSFISTMVYARYSRPTECKNTYDIIGVQSSEKECPPGAKLSIHDVKNEPDKWAVMCTCPNTVDEGEQKKGE